MKKIKILIIIGIILIIAASGFALISARENTGAQIILDNEYQFAEMIIPQLVTLTPAWLLKGEDSLPYEVYKLQNGTNMTNETWIKLQTIGGPLEEIIFCINGELWNHTEQQKEKCALYNPNMEMHWYPLHTQTKPAYCSNISYDALYLGLANPGTYKIRFELFSAGCTGNPLIAEKNFTIISGPQQNNIFQSNPLRIKKSFFDIF